MGLGPLGEDLLQPVRLSFGFTADMDGVGLVDEPVYRLSQQRKFALEDLRLAGTEAHGLFDPAQGSGLESGVVTQLCFEPGFVAQQFGGG